MWTDKQPPRPIAQRTHVLMDKVTRWIKPACPHCKGPLLAQVTEITEHQDGSWYASAVDVVCESRKCQKTEHRDDGQNTWQPILDNVKQAINRRYHFQP